MDRTNRPANGIPSRTSGAPRKDLAVSVRSASHLGAALKRLRKRRKWTQRKLGEHAGMKQASVSSVESGALGTRIETVFKLLAALDLELVVRKRGTGGGPPGEDD